ncbi:MAG: ABC transporter permease, partial [Thermoanaerobaculia bacterium]|nr:ABC transporter permease [Thermoanaerobaculia bacterium]
ATAQSARFALRRLRKRPGFTATAILSLAIGVGANVAIFTLVNAIMIRDVPLEDPERLFDLYVDNPDFRYQVLSYPDFDDARRATEDLLVGLAASRVAIAQTDREGSPETIAGEAVTGNYFSVLGIPALIGRPLLPDDDVAPGAHPVAVLSHDYWQSRYGGDAGAVGGEIRINGMAYEIVGVAPAEYPGNLRGLNPAFYAPRMMVNQLLGNPGDELQQRGNHANFVKGRLRPGVSLSEVEAALAGLAADLAQRDPPGWDPRNQFELVPTADVLMYPPIDNYIRASAWFLSVVVGLVLLLACTNLAGFLLAQAIDRRKEISLRLAIGATRGDLVAQLLTESLVLATLGGLAGLAVGAGLLRLLVGADLPLPLPITLDLSLDTTVLAYALAVSVAAGVFLGLLPALQSTRPDLASTLKEEGAGGGQPGKLRLRNAMIGIQVAVSTVLLVGAGLFLRSLQERAAIDPGFGREPAAVLSMVVSGQRFDEDEGRAYMRDLLARFERLPGVEAVGLTANLHLNQLSTSTTSFNVDGVDPPPDREAHPADNTVIDPGFFDAVGIRIVEGRNFDEHDLPDRRGVAIVNQTLAERFFPGTSAVGRMLRMGGDPEDDLEIVGVASNAKIRTIGEEPRTFVYVPLSQVYSWGGTVVARTSRDPEALAMEMLGEAQRFDPEFWAWEVKTMERHIGSMLIGAQLSALVLGAFAVLAMALAGIGLYGVVAYAVSQRTREIGIRLSLGADTRSVVSLLMQTGLRPVVWGGALGLLLALGVGRLASRLLYGVSTFDPLSLIGTLLVLALTALAAAWLPARRASRVSPSLALRNE